MKLGRISGFGNCFKAYYIATLKEYKFVFYDCQFFIQTVGSISFVVSKMAIVGLGEC